MNAGIVAGLVLVGSGLLGAFVLLFQDSTNRRIAERLASVQRDGEIVGQGASPTSTIRRVQQTRIGWLDAMLRWVGYNPDNPVQYTIPWPVVAVVAGGMGVLTWQYGKSTTGPILGVLSTLGSSFFAARSMFAFQTRKYTTALLKQLPDTIGLIVRGASVGVPPGEAIRTIAREVAKPTGPEFARVVGEVAVGTPVEAAIWNIYFRTGLTEYSFLAVAIGLQQRSGGNLSETLDNLADIIRKRIGMAARARALAAESKMAAIILVALPFAAGTLLELERPGYFDPMFSTDQGARMIKIMVVLMGAGIMSIRWLMRKAAEG